jgi:class 3 adenylate cyclase
MPVKTVVELDLVGYAAICDLLQDGGNVETVARLNDQIQGFVDAGLAGVGAERAITVMQTTGDGAILLFDGAEVAHRFAAELHAAARDHNRTRHHSIGKRVFRVGIATGELHVCPMPGGGHSIAGMAIVNAVRLEQTAPPGGVLVDEATFSGLSPDQQRMYGPVVSVQVKPHDPPFDARQCVCDPDGTAASAAFREPVPSARKPTAGPPPNRADPIPEAVLRALLQTARVAEAPADLERALRRGLDGVERILDAVGNASRHGLELEHVQTVVQEAIRHGAGIYNHSAAGRVGCARIYHRAAVGLASLSSPPRSAEGTVPNGASIATEWLKRIVADVPIIDVGNGDDTAWELRYAFDATDLVPQLDDATFALAAAARQPDPLPAIGHLLRQIVERGRKFRDPPDVAYYFLHAVRVLVHLAASKRSLARHVEPFRRIQDERPRILRDSADELANRLLEAIVRFCQNLEAGIEGPTANRPARKWWPFGK